MGRIKDKLISFYNLYCDIKIVKARREELKIFLSKEYTKDAVPVNAEVGKLKQLQNSYYDYIRGDDGEFSFFPKDILFDKNKREELSDQEIFRSKDSVFIPKKLIEDTKKKVKLTDVFKDEQLTKYYCAVDKNIIRNMPDYSSQIDEILDDSDKDNFLLVSKNSIRNQILSLEELIHEKEKGVIKEESKIQNNFNKAEYLSQNYLFLKDRVSEWLMAEMKFFREKPEFTRLAVENFIGYKYGNLNTYQASLVEKKNFESTLHYFHFDKTKDLDLKQVHSWFIEQGVMDRQAELVFKGVFHRLRFQETFECSFKNYLGHKIKKQRLFEQKNVTYFALYFKDKDAKAQFENKRDEFNRSYQIDDLIENLFQINPIFAINDNNNLNELLYKNKDASYSTTRMRLGNSEEVYSKRKILIGKNIEPEIKYLLPRVYKNIPDERIKNIKEKVKDYGLDLKIGYAYIKHGK